MFKAEVNESRTKLECSGTIAQICSALANIINAVNESMEKNDAGEEFRTIFTKGFMDGVCFKADREAMEKYLDRADRAERGHKAFSAIEDILDMLKKSRDEMQAARLDLDALAKEVVDDVNAEPKAEAEPAENAEEAKDEAE